LFHEKLVAEDIWLPIGGVRFVVYAAIFWIAASMLIFLRPRWLFWTWAWSLSVYSVWWCGLAPVAVLYFSGSCFLLGRILRLTGVFAFLVGLAVWIFVFSISAHFPVNTRSVYGVGLALPFFFQWRDLRSWPRVDLQHKEAAALALLLFILTAHLLVALKPEVSPDGLSMHLTVPLAVEHYRRWNFDFQTYTWAVQALGGELAFTAPVIFAGESAAGLLNFAMLGAIVALVYQASRFYASQTIALLCAALFASTPLVQLVTGSLFVENVWCALIIGAILSALHYLETHGTKDLVAGAMLAGAAMSVKPLAGAFIPAMAIIYLLGFVAVRRVKAASIAIVLFLVFSAPPYLYAWIKTGNPVFPQFNQMFHSPYLNASTLADQRFQTPLRVTTPYEVTFRTHKFNEAQNGSAGFQYFILLLPAVILIRRRDQAALLASGITGALVILATLPNLRYIYPALAIFSICIAWLAAELPETIAVILGLTALNIYFLPASGWNHRDFALFRKEDVRAYVERYAPQRILIDYLNRESQGEAVAFFGPDYVAGLHAPSYSDSWHSEMYWTQLRELRAPEDVFRLMQGRQIRRVIAPKSLESSYTAAEKFLRAYTEKEITVDDYALFRVNSAPRIVPPPAPAPLGAYDDFDERIDYQGQWFHDRQFADASGGSITYSHFPSDSVHFLFNGQAITWLFTKAANRGSANVLIDGAEVDYANLYSQTTEWQTRKRYEKLGAGPHTIEIRVVTGFIDVDGFIVK
jgi:hypothetical protein